MAAKPKSLHNYVVAGVSRFKTKETSSSALTALPTNLDHVLSSSLVVAMIMILTLASTQNTNVIELYSQLLKDKKQLTYYDSGIGTYATPSWKSLYYWKQV
jgi:uncharacterized protein (DUF2235 family)